MAAFLSDSRKASHGVASVKSPTTLAGAHGRPGKFKGPLRNYELGPSVQRNPKGTRALAPSKIWKTEVRRCDSRRAWRAVTTEAVGVCGLDRKTMIERYTFSLL